MTGRRIAIAGIILFVIILVPILIFRSDEGKRSNEVPVGTGDGGGAATIEPDKPVPCAMPMTWTVIYIAGPDGIAEGGGVVFHLPLFWEWSPPQMSTPQRPGFVTVETSNPGIIIESYANDQQHYVHVTVRSGRLAGGDVIRVVYGDPTERGIQRAKARSDAYAEKGQEFLVKVDGDGDGHYREIENSPSLDILPGTATRLRINLKGEAYLNDTTLVTVAALDRFGNRAVDYTGTVWFSHKWNVLGLPRSYAFQAEDMGAKSFPVRFTSPGYIRQRVVEEGGTLEGLSNPVLVKPRHRAEPYTLLWGDLHQHSRFSDGTGRPEDLYLYGRDVSNLDVMALTDHDHFGLRPLRERGGWERLQRVTESFNEPGRFVTFHGYEWTNWEYGHRNVYYSGSSAPLFSTADSTTNRPDLLWDNLPAGSSMTIAHHSGGGPIPTDWSYAPPPSLECLVEISSVHGSSEHYGCPGEIYNPKPGSFIRDALVLGYRLGFIGSGDGHIGHPGENYAATGPGGMAGIYAAGRTREDVWEALRARRTYATSGPRIHFLVKLGEHWMGEEVEAATLPDTLHFHVSACGTVQINLAELIHDGVSVDTLFGSENKLEGYLKTPKPSGDAADSYYVRLIQMDDAMAWSSPIWIK